MSKSDLDGPLPESLSQAQAWLSSGAISSESLCTAMLKRIHLHNGHSRSVRTIFEERALADAVESDKRRITCLPVPPLSGIPWLVKENIDVLPGPVSAGLDFLASRIPSHEAWIVRKLREAGAVVLGTCVSDPGAFGVRTDRVRHPTVPGLTVGGSSGGSAAALAMGFAFAALGTDTGGSIRIPSACCGTVGLKPTFAALSTEGLYPLVPSLDHVGPMTRTVEDMSLVWNALVPSHGKAEQPIGELRFGWAPEWLILAQKDVRSAFLAALSTLSKRGFQIVEIRLPDLKEVAHAHFVHFCDQATKLHLDEFGYTPMMFGTEAQEAFRMGRSLEISEIGRVENRRKELRSRVDSALEGLDALLIPTMPVLRPHLKNDSFLIGGKSMGFTASLVLFTSLFNHSGHPVLTTPNPGTTPDQLHSVQWVGHWGNERALLDAVCAAFDVFP